MTDWGSDFKALARSLKADEDQVIRATILNLTKAITEANPVGNPSLWKNKPPAGYVGGQSKGNWFPSISVASNEVDLTIKGEGADETSNQRVFNMLDQAKGNKFFVTNNLPYIRRLEYGWSTQAPEGMVRPAVQRVPQIIKKAIKALT